MPSENYDLEAAIADLEDSDDFQVVEDLPAVEAPEEESAASEAPEEESAASEPQQDEPVAEAEDQPRYITEEQWQQEQNRNQLWRQQVAQEMAQRQAQAAPSREPDPQPRTQFELKDEYGNTYEDPLAARVQELEDRYNREIESLRQANYAQAVMHKRQEISSTVNRLAEQYPDFHEFVPIENIEAARVQAERAGRLDVNWEQALYQTYAAKALPAYQKRANEMAAKREEKRAEQASQAAAAVTSGGGVYQAPKVKHDPFERGYGTAEKAAMAELEMMGG